jgi:hypothetical protein
MQNTGILFAMIARIPVEGIAAFQAYEAEVLPLLAEHGGVLQRRLRSADAAAEVHLVWFPSDQAFEGYQADPRRSLHAPLMQTSGAAIELLRLSDVV